MTARLLTAFSLLLATLGVASAAHADVCQTVAPADAATLRVNTATPLHRVSGLSVDQQGEDRVVIELDLDRLPASFGHVTLDFGLAVDVEPGWTWYFDTYHFAGDGVVAPDDFDAGTIYVRRAGTEPEAALSIDVTRAVREARAAGERYVGLRLEAPVWYAGQFLLGASAGLADPVVSVRPEELAAPADIGSVRFRDGGLYLLTFLAVKALTEDRFFVELDLAPYFGQPVSEARLTFVPYNLDHDKFVDGVLDVFTYPGDGVVTVADFDAGTPYASFVSNTAGPTVDVDLTAAVLDALAAGQRYLGVRFSTTTLDRYDIASQRATGLQYLIWGPDPVLKLRVADCPFGDRDGDGVPDDDDACPDEAPGAAGDVDTDGCPDAPEDVATAIDATVPTLPGGSDAALTRQIDDALARIADAEAALADGDPARAGRLFCQARGKLDTFIDQVETKVADGAIDPATGAELVDLARALQNLVDLRLAEEGLPAC